MSGRRLTSNAHGDRDTSHRFSIRNLNRAMIAFTRPAIGQTIHQENTGQVDKRLRNAIEKAHEAYEREMLRNVKQSDIRDPRIDPKTGDVLRIGDSTVMICYASRERIVLALTTWPKDISPISEWGKPWREPWQKFAANAEVIHCAE